MQALALECSANMKGVFVLTLHANVKDERLCSKHMTSVVWGRENWEAVSARAWVGECAAVMDTVRGVIRGWEGTG